jgi:hypothetical protein
MAHLGKPLGPLDYRTRGEYRLVLGVACRCSPQARRPVPKTPEGKARVVAAMVAGRRRWVERMKAEGRKFPGGRKPGSRIVRGAKQTVVVRLPEQYRHMSFDEFIEAGKEALKVLHRSGWSGRAA